MKRTTLFWCCILLCSTTLCFAQNTLEAARGILSNDTYGDGVQSWGDNVTLQAFKIDGSPARLKFDSQFRDKGFGVEGARWDQIDYYQDYQGQRVDASEKIIINFNGPVTDVVLRVGMMGANEGHPDGETGKWTGYDSNGNEIASGVLGANDSNLGPEVKLVATSYGIYPIDLTASQPLYSIAIEATAWGYGQGAPRNVNSYNNDSGNKENNTDFNIGAITYTRVGSEPTNTAPVANNDAPGPIREDIGLTAFSYDVFLANDTDAEGDNLRITSFDFSNFPGIIEDKRGDRQIEFRTEVNFNGTIRIPYTITDGTNTDTAIITLTITDVIDNLTLGQDGPYTLNTNESLSVPIDELLANDTASNFGSPITIELTEVGDAVNGGVEIVGDNVIFTPTAGFAGEASFTYSVVVLSGGVFGPDKRVDEGTSNPIVVNVNGDAPENNSPIAQNDGAGLVVNEGETLIIPFATLLANDSDPDGDPLTIIAVENVRAIDVRIVGETVEYVAVSGTSASGLFRYTVSDGRGGTAIASVFITVLNPISINQKAVLVSKANEDLSLQVNSTGNRTSVVVEECEEQGQIWTISDRGNGFHKIINDYAEKALEAWQRSPSNGDDVTIYSSNNLDWQQWEFIDAGRGYFFIKGKYNERYMTLSDGNAIMLNENGLDNQLWKFLAPEDVDCSSIPQNNPPIAVEDGDPLNDPNYTLTVGETLVIPFAQLLANDSDPDGDALTITAVNNERGSNIVEIVGETVEFTGVSAFPGSLFTYTLSDGRGGEDIGFVFLNVLNLPEEPTFDAVDDNPGPVREDIGLTAFSYDVFLANDIGDNLRITSFDFSNFPGIIEDKRGDRQIEFRTEVNFNGTIRIPYTITDGTNTDTAIITLTITDVIDNLTLGQDGPYTLNTNESLSVPIDELLANDTASNFGSPITIELTEVGDAVNGGVEIVGDNVIFTPTAGFAGEASFTYSVVVLSGGVFGPDKRVDEGTSNSIVVNIITDNPNEPLDEVLLESKNISPDGSSNAQQWGTCTQITAFDASGNPASIGLFRGRIGVEGNRFPQLDYDPNTETSERLVVNFNRPVTSVSFTLGNLETAEWDGFNETGIWRLMDDNGVQIAEGLIDPKLGIKAGRSVYRFDINASVPVVSLQLEATAYGHGQGPDRRDNNSDYSLISVAFNPLQTSCSGITTMSAISALPPSIYPTLVKDFTNIEIEKNSNTIQEIRKVYFYNNVGVLMKQTEMSSEGTQRLDVSDLRPGLYIVRLITNTGVFSYKIIKQ